MDSGTIVLIITTFLGGGTLVAIIQAVANRRNVDATRQNTLATGYGAFTDDLREELKDTKKELTQMRVDFDAESRENHLMRFFLADMLRYMGGIQKLAAENSLQLPDPPPVPAGLSFP